MHHGRGNRIGSFEITTSNTSKIINDLWQAGIIEQNGQEKTEQVGGNGDNPDGSTEKYTQYNLNTIYGHSLEVLRVYDGKVILNRDAIERVPQVQNQFLVRLSGELKPDDIGDVLNNITGLKWTQDASAEHYSGKRAFNLVVDADRSAEVFKALIEFFKDVPLNKEKLQQGIFSFGGKDFIRLTNEYGQIKFNVAAEDITKEIGIVATKLLEKKKEMAAGVLVDPKEVDPDQILRNILGGGIGLKGS